MKGDRDKPERSTDDDGDLQREIRAGRKFTLSEAIGRLAGAGVMKGASPVSRKQQAVSAIEEYLSGHVADAAGTLSSVLLRQVKDSALLLDGAERPLVVLANHVRRILDSEYALQELVREVDMEWGRVFGERPHFEREGGQPAAEDPYTLESVRAALTRLSAELLEAEA